MKLDVTLIPIIFGLAVATLSVLKPVEVNKPDLSAVFLYWSEAYKYAERGDPAVIYRVAPLVSCNNETVSTPPGLSYKTLALICRFKP
ncbi:hypothetical protein [Pyrobaculum ferrireducens]|uniref:Uncharacterized protein n=1 Tax=Pyrobaculum ferrireducens TaxID=1104324 RepID=G7VCT3_9CREN|nr:hypothetical protein [Pyrobaculum ferrireducens]AET32622.1 hypothetical protein P186_1191 [Pyrobaculum ferrireducens]